MKQILLAALLVLLSATHVFADAAVTSFGALNEGGATALDSVECDDRLNDDTDTPLVTGDMAIGTVSDVLYVYEYDSTGSDPESSPTIIVPDDRVDCTNGQWNIVSISGDISGNAATATALAANGADCSAGSYPLGVDASGAAASCTDATTEINSAISTHSGSVTAHTSLTSLAVTTSFEVSGSIIGCAASDCTIDGNGIYRAGGTDVADDDVADDITVSNYQPLDSDLTAASDNSDFTFTTAGAFSAASTVSAGTFDAGCSDGQILQSDGTDLECSSTVGLEFDPLILDESGVGTDNINIVAPATVTSYSITVPSAACAENEIWKTQADLTFACAADSTGGTPSFDAVTTGANAAALSVTTGGQLRPINTGVIQANEVDAVGAAALTVGSADVTTITLTTDGTGTAEVALSAGSIDGTEILDDTIDSADYAAGSIDNEHMAANSVDSDQYVDNSIDNAHMADNSVDSDDYVDGSIDSVHISTIVSSIAWNAAGINVDGTQCNAPSAVQLNSGPYHHTIICADNDASTMYGHVVMPDSWDFGTVTFEVEYVQTAADTSALNSDVSCMCRGATETINSTYGTEIAIDDAALTGSNAVDHTTSAAVTCNGTCAAGDTLFWQLQLDATGTTTAVATLHFLGVKMEYTSNVGD